MSTIDKQQEQPPPPEVSGVTTLPGQKHAEAPAAGKDGVSSIQEQTSTLGAQVWFEIPVVLTMLMLGAYTISRNAPSTNPYLPIALLTLYALINLLQGRMTRSSSSPTAWPSLRLSPYYLPISNFVLDLAFTAAISTLSSQNTGVLTAVLLTFAGTRFLAYVAGRSAPLAVLPAVIPVAFLLLQVYPPPGRLMTSQEPITEALIISCYLIIAHTIFRKLNPRFAEGQRLTTLIGERDQSLRESHEHAEQVAERLARQVLRLDLLQKSISAMNSAIELDDLLKMVVDNAARVLNAEQSSIGLIDRQTGELVIRAATGIAQAELQQRRFSPGVGVAGWVVKHGQPLMVGDVLLDAHYVDWDETKSGTRPTRSMLCVPLTVEQKVIGALCVTHSLPDALTAEDQSLLTSFSDQAALAVHKSQLLEERTRQSEELQRRGLLISSLHSIGQSVLSSLDLSQVLTTIISRISELSNFDYAAIYLVDDHTGLEELVSTSGVDDPRSRVLSLVEGTPAMDLWKQAQINKIAQAHIGDQCVMCVALVNLNVPIGCILLARNSPDPFNQVDRDTAEKLTEAATIAIVNARLFSTVSLQQQQTAALYRMMLRVNAASNRKQLAQAVCAELLQITGARGSALLMEDSDRTRISVWATCGEWSFADASNISLPAQGDPFISSTLVAIHRAQADDLLMIPNAPLEVARAFGSATCVTIPLAQGHRLYGLLVLEPGSEPLIPADIREMVRLAVSHSTVALERAELYDQTLTSARQSSMLYSIAAEVQTSLDPARVMQMIVNSAIEALPIQSCEVYIFEDGRKSLRRNNMAISSDEENGDRLLGPAVLSIEADPSLLDVLYSAGLVEEQPQLDVQGYLLEEGEFTLQAASRAAHSGGLAVLRGRLMGTNEATGIVRLTTTLPVQEFIHRHAAFCQTLLTHSGGAIERSRLYTTVTSQAEMLQVRAQQLTDILNIGSLSAADVPLTSMMPQIASGIANSLDFAYVRIGDIGPDSSNTEIWASGDKDWSGVSGITARALSLDSLEQLLEAGEPLAADVRGAHLDEAILARVLPAQPRLKPGVTPRRLVLIMLESTGGGVLGYILAALKAEALLEDFVEVLSIFAQRTALLMENHRVYSQLLDSKRKIEAVVLSIGDGVIVTDANLNILISNSLADELLGVPTGESRGQELKRLIQNQKLIDLLQDCLASSRPGSMDVDFHLGKGVLTFEAIVHSITAPDLGVLGTVLTLRDVTVARSTERAKSDFLSMVSHELRTPLNSVLGFLDIILMGKTGELNDLQVDFLGTAKQEAVVLQRLINDVLDYSQLNSGMLRMEMTPMNLSSVISRVVKQAIPRAEEDKLTVNNNVPAGLVVVGDEVRLEQVFKNLLDNAAKCTDQGGEINFDCQVSGKKVLISVRDNGCGIPAGQIESVFERFFQAENKSQRRKRGLGLGLPICKNIIEAHAGRIWIESELEVGTVVNVEFDTFDPGGRFHDFDIASTQVTAGTRSAKSSRR